MELVILPVPEVLIRAEHVGTTKIEINKEGIDSKDTVPEYIGETEIIPAETEQVLPVKDYRLASNIVVKPIPSNYGRVSYNGAKLRIE